MRQPTDKELLRFLKLLNENNTLIAKKALLESRSGHLSLEFDVAQKELQEVQKKLVSPEIQALNEMMKEFGEGDIPRGFNLLREAAEKALLPEEDKQEENLVEVVHLKDPTQ